MELIPAKTIVTKTKDSSWFGTKYRMNIYKGCSHGCIYCDSRSDCYRIDSFDTIKAKEKAMERIRDDLRRKVQKGVVGTGSMSDPYNPLERDHMLTRHALELLYAYGFGAAIATKSDLIVRDIDVLKNIKDQAAVLCKITITTCDDDLASKIEPCVCSSSARFAALEKLACAGLFSGILLMPVLPYLTDSEENIRGVVHKAADSGVRFIYPAFGMTLRDGQRTYYYKKLDTLFPGLSAAYQQRYGQRYNCTCPNAKRLYTMFAEECEKKGILYQMHDIINAYQLGYENTQLSFL